MTVVTHTHTHTKGRYGNPATLRVFNTQPIWANTTPTVSVVRTLTSEACLALCPVMCDRRSASKRSFGNLHFLKFPFIFPFLLAAPFSFLPFLLSVSYASLQYFSLLTSLPLLCSIPCIIVLLSVSTTALYFLLSLSFSSIFSCSVHTCIILFLTLSYRFVFLSISFLSTFLFPHCAVEMLQPVSQCMTITYCFCLQKKMVVF